MLNNMIKASGYALPIREVSEFFGISRKEKKLKRSQYSNIAIGITLGTAVGLATGLLLAPRSGSYSRKRIADQAHSIVQDIKEKADQARK